MILGTPRSTRTDTLFPYTTLFRSIYVRVSPGMPMVEILTRLAHDVRSRRQAALEVSVLNRTHPMVKFLLHDRSVLLVLSIPAMPFAHHHLRSEEHTSELQSLMRISYAVFCLKKKNTQH